MRLSSSMMVAKQLSNLMETYNSYSTAASQVSSGLRVTKPSDDPIAASQATLVAQAQATSERYGTARDSANTSLSVEDTTLDQITDTIQNIQTLLVKVGNTTYSDADRESMSVELQALKDQLVSLGNTTDGSGNYVFGGYASGTAPFSVATDGTVTYNGSDTAISLSVSSSRSIIIGDVGSDLYGSNGSNIFDTIDSVLSAMSTTLDGTDSTAKEAYSTTINNALSTMDSQYNSVLNIQTKVGAKMTELTALDSQSSTMDVVNSDRKSALIEADYAESYSNYASLKVALQASYSVVSTLGSLSLFSMNS